MARRPKRISCAPVVLPTLHSGQQKILDNRGDSRWHAVCCGRRFGKTILLIQLALSYATTTHKNAHWDNQDSKLTAEERSREYPGRVAIFGPEVKNWRPIFKSILLVAGSLVKSHSVTDGEIHFKNGGFILFSHLKDDLVARGHWFHLVLIDEASFTKSPLMVEKIWQEAILPTLADHRGDCFVFSTPIGKDETNFFYCICHHPERYGFKFHHAPTSDNPWISEEDIEFSRERMDPRKFRQEFLAEFIDWGGDAFFSLEPLMIGVNPTSYIDEQGVTITTYEKFEPHEAPEHLDGIEVICDSGMKGTEEHDGHAFIYVGWKEYKKPEYNEWGEQLVGYKVWLLDYDITTYSGAIFEESLARTFDRALELRRRFKVWRAFNGIQMEDKALGQNMIQKSQAGNLKAGRHTGEDYCRVTALNSKWTAAGKDGRAFLVQDHHWSRDVMMTRDCFEKVVEYKKDRCNHLVSQITSFKVADKDAKKRADDLLDAYTYALLYCMEKQ